MDNLKQGPLSKPLETRVVSKNTSGCKFVIFEKISGHITSGEHQTLFKLFHKKKGSRYSHEANAAWKEKNLQYNHASKRWKAN